MRSLKFLILVLILLSLAINSFAKIYKGAEYRTKSSYIYGRFEARIKSANREGMLSSFFTYHDEGGSTNWNEIDIEILGRYPNDVQFNTITPGQSNHVGHYPLFSSPHLDYHTYAIEWTPDYVAWFIDDVEVLRQTGAHIQTLNKDQKIMMNIWNPQYENWAGTFNPDALPAFAFYDWVSYYTYTPGSGDYGTDNNFTHDWTDDFDSWDTIRWDKATHTWDGNGCDFIYDNAVFQDGKLILCLTKETNTGYSDIQPPIVFYARGESESKVVVAFSEELEETTSQSTSNYLIPDITVNSATLLSDLKTVELNVSGLDLNSTKTIIISGIMDRALTPNTMSARALTIIMAKPLQFPVKINCGGFSTLGYLADQGWGEMNEYGYLDGSLYSNSYQINGTNEDEIYHTELNGNVNYQIRLPNGHYDVKLMFSENFFTSVDQRKFDVYLEENKVLVDLDIYQLVGSHTAYEAPFTNIQVDDGVLEIYFAAKINNGLLNGILITQNTTGLINEPGNFPQQFKVEQNYPNPFNGSTIINYYLPQQSPVFFSVYDILGNLVYSKDSGEVASGSHNIEWQSVSNSNKPIVSGVYLATLQSKFGTHTQKIILLK